jgi:hypothetical protein
VFATGGSSILCVRSCPGVSCPEIRGGLVGGRVGCGVCGTTGAPVEVGAAVCATLVAAQASKTTVVKRKKNCMLPKSKIVRSLLMTDDFRDDVRKKFADHNIFIYCHHP